MSTRKNSAFAALQYHDFRALWIGNIISQIGTRMWATVIFWHIWQLTRSEFSIGLVGLAGILPVFLFALIGGLSADRWDRKKVILGSQTVMLAFSLLLTVTTLSGHVTPMIIYLCTAVHAGAVAFEQPGRGALLPRLVPEKHLQNALSLNVVMFQMALMVGPALAGVVLSIAGPGTAYLLDLLSYLAAIIGVLLIRTSGGVRRSRESGMVAVRQGIRHVVKTPLIWSTMLLDFGATFFASALTLLPVLSEQVLKVGEVGYGVLMASPAFGATLAGIILARLGNFRRQGWILLGSIAVFGLATIVFGLTSSFSLAAVALAITGAADSVSAVIRNMIRQLYTSDEMRGRMTGINMMFYMGGPKLGEFEAGVLAGLTNAQFSVVVGGVATIIMIAIAMLKMPFVRRFDGFSFEESAAAPPFADAAQPAAD